MTRPPPLIADERLNELATGFAVGSLDEEELVELHDLLRQQGPQQKQAVLACWQSLQTTVNLRAMVDHSFKDTVQMRVAEPQSPTFVQSVLSRIGLRRQGLPSVTAPDLRPAKGLLRWLLAALVILLLLVLVLFLSLRRDNAVLAVVSSVHGHAQQLGTPLVADMPVQAGLFTLAAGGDTTLELRAGGIVKVRGPAQFALHDSGISLTSGRFSVRNGREVLMVTLPDGTVTLDPDAAIESQSDARHSATILRHGSATRQILDRGDHAAEAMAPEAMAPEAMAPGMVYQQQHSPWVWTQAATPVSSDKNDGRSKVTQLAGTPQAVTWSLEAIVALGKTSSTITFYDSLNPRRTVRIGADSITVSDRSGTVLNLTISGPPLGQRLIHLQRHLDGSCSLRAAGFNVSIPFVGPPLRLEKDGPASLSGINYYDGPKP